MCAEVAMQCVQVSDLQGSVQELQEALDKEVAVHKDSQTTLEEAYRDRNRLEARYVSLIGTLYIGSRHLCSSSV